MPTIEENRRHWGADYGWPDAGEEWSEVWGGSEAQWTGSILPRIGRFLPVGRIVEIGCGHGRWSRRLRPLGRELDLFDLVPGCVEACRSLFAGDDGVRCFATDGTRLTEVGDGEIDFAFSFDSLVHAEQDVLSSYLRELGSKLAPEGVAFLHHSNIAAVLAAKPGTANRHWRGESVSAESVAGAAAAAGLRCRFQEVVDWGDVLESDCFSVVVRPGSRWDGPPRRVRNEFFMGEAQSLGRRVSLYGSAG